MFNMEYNDEEMKLECQLEMKSYVDETEIEDAEEIENVDEDEVVQEVDNELDCTEEEVDFYDLSLLTNVTGDVQLKSSATKKIARKIVKKSSI